MLALVSAVVAFDRWPGANVRTPIHTLVLNERAHSIRVSASAVGRSTPAAARTTGRSGAAAAPRAVAPTGVVGGGVVGARPIAGGTSPLVPSPAAPPLPPAPDVPSPDTIVNSISNPGTTASQIADGTQAVTDNAGRSLTNLNPDVGTTVTDAGQAVAQTVRGVPLPDHVVPGR
jgi:hypothetical protein